MKLNQKLMLEAPNNRHGISFEPQKALLSMSDIHKITHMGVPGSIESPWQSAAGGVAFDEDTAKLASIGEAIERYCATISQLPLKSRDAVSKNNRVDAEEWCLFTPEQRQKENFPFGNIYSSKCMYTNVFDFQNNQEKWIPHPLVALRDDYQTGVPTSSGLAAGPNTQSALLRAIQELIERDALMTTWLHCVPGRRIAMPAEYESEVTSLSGEVKAYDLTPAYSPFPVIAVAGSIPKRGKKRYSLGVACREDIDSALTKAYLEWNQGILFAGIYDRYVDTSSINDPIKLKSFDEHAIYYTLYPEKWPTLPLLQNDKIQRPSIIGKKSSVRQALTEVKNHLAKNKIRIFYRDITTIDAMQLGISVIRATSPDMAQIFAHQEWPLLGGVKEMLKNRYPWAPDSLDFPNLMPHPLG